MRKFLIVSTFATMFLASSTAHAIIDCWYSFSGHGTICEVISVGNGLVGGSFRANSEIGLASRAVHCEDAAWLLYDHCPVIEDTGDGTEADFMLCEDAPLLVDELCGAQ